jgi:hypothetical protein
VVERDSGEFRGKAFISEASAAQILKTPTWPAKKQSPPLSPRKAEKLATKRLHSLLHELKDPAEWDRGNICLEDVGVPDAKPRGDHYWIYIISFRCCSGNSAPSEFGLLNIVVLMDGTAIQPKFADQR